MRTPSDKTKSNPGLLTLIAATCKLWQPYHLTYDQARDVAKVVQQVLGLARPKTCQCVVARLSREEERRLIAHTYRGRLLSGADPGASRLA